MKRYDDGDPTSYPTLWVTLLSAGYLSIVLGGLTLGLIARAYVLESIEESKQEFREKAKAFEAAAKQQLELQRAVKDADQKFQKRLGNQDR